MYLPAHETLQIFYKYIHTATYYFKCKYNILRVKFLQPPIFIKLQWCILQRKALVFQNRLRRNSHWNDNQALPGQENRNWMQNEIENQFENKTILVEVENYDMKYQKEE